jgi:uncharacterized protein YjdB
VISSDGNFTLTIPAGALDAATTVTVTKVDASTPTRLGSDPLALTSSISTAANTAARTLVPSWGARTVTAPVYIAGSGYKVEPEALALKVAATVQIKFDAAALPTGIDAQLLRIRRRERTQDQWQDCTHLGLTANQVQARVMNFATFALYGWSTPPSGSSGALLDAAGGTVTSADGNFILTIPAGALETSTQVIVTKVDVAALTRVASDPLAATLTPMGGPLSVAAPVYIAGTGYQVEPGDLVLKQPASVQIKFDPATLPSGMDPQLLRIHRRTRAQDQTQDQWEECTHAGVQENAVAATTTGFSVFALYGTPKEPPAAASVTVSPATLDVETSDVVQLSVQVLDAEGSVLDVPITWAVDNPTVATVDATGLLTALTDGTTSVTATAAGKQGSASVTVRRKVGSVVIGAVPTELVEGDSAQLAAEVFDPTGASVPSPTVTWTSLSPGVAIIDETGKVTGVSAGEAQIVATSRDKSDTASVTVVRLVASVSIETAPTELIEGESTQLVADVRDPAGARMSNPKVTWTSLTPTVAMVDGTGKVTGVSAGSTSIVASSQKKSDTLSVTVHAPPTSVVISGNSQQALMPGATRQLSATAYNGSGLPVPVKVRWTSNSIAVATVSESGLVTGVARGQATISAAYGTVSSSVDVRVAGESGELGNNLSWPVVFAEGTGLTGLPVSQDAGMRPTSEENVVVDARPFFFSGNAHDCAVGTVSYFCQQGANVWQAEWLDGSSGPPRSAEVKWGDNLTHHTYGTHTQIHVEVSLNDLDAGQLRGFNMTVISGSGPTEMQGTDGSIGQFVPTLFTGAARLIVEKLDDIDTTRAPVLTLLDQGLWQKGDGPGQFGAEVTVSGRLVYGYNFKIQDLDTSIFGGAHKYGWWRLTLVIGGSGAPADNVFLRQVAAQSSEEEEPPKYTPVVSADGRRTSLTIYVNKDGGGGEH